MEHSSNIHPSLVYIKSARVIQRPATTAGLIPALTSETVGFEGLFGGTVEEAEDTKKKIPFGTSLFFVKDKGKLRSVVAYGALNRMTKRNNAPLQRPDEIFV